jgi:aspartate oxidase
MSDFLVTDVLVVGEGCAGQTAALTASESGCDVIMLGDGRAPSTAVSTGFLTYAAHEGFDRVHLYEAMSQTTGKGLCDPALLRRRVRAGRSFSPDWTPITEHGVPSRTRRA